MAFNHKKIDLAFSLGKGATGEAGSQVISVKGLRVSASITMAGTDQNECALTVYGLTHDLMNKLSFVGTATGLQKQNDVLVMAGDDINGMNEVFRGNIVYAWPDFMARPQVAMRIEAKTGTFAGVKPVEITSFSGNVEVKTALEQIAKKMDRTSEITGSLGQLSDPYFYGSAMSQLKSLAAAGRFAWVDENQRTIAAWPMDSARQGSAYVISKQTGMVGTPIGTPTGVLVKQLFAKPTKFGTTIQIVSENANEATGKYYINKVNYNLESEMPHGEWFMTIDAYMNSPGGE